MIPTGAWSFFSPSFSQVLGPNHQSMDTMDTKSKYPGDKKNEEWYAKSAPQHAVQVRQAAWCWWKIRRHWSIFPSSILKKIYLKNPEKKTPHFRTGALKKGHPPRDEISLRFSKRKDQLKQHFSTAKHVVNLDLLAGTFAITISSRILRSQTRFALSTECHAYASSSSSSASASSSSSSYSYS